ncbi:type II secretion system protein [bacterium]|nr:type II secretion system protein [bacterium]
MNKELRIEGEVKSSCSNGFGLVLDALVPITKKTQKFVAFTLAETLIVIGVIGIVSALTLPNLNSSTGDKERVAKVKKIYQNLQDAFGRAEAVYGPYEEWFVNEASDAYEARAKRAGERITEFMKTSKVCAQETGKGCFTSGKSKTIVNEDHSNFDSDSRLYKIITADGATISISNAATPLIIVDIDGPNKGPYTLGKDIFGFDIGDNGEGVLPCLHNWELNKILSEDITNKGISAATWIIKYDNADYLKLNSRGKCPNGTTPTEANPRCK